MVFYSRDGEQLYFNPGCGCSWSPREPRSWDDAAVWINMQTSVEWRNKIAARFGIDLEEQTQRMKNEIDIRQG